jgi:hypothetical protein
MEVGDLAWIGPNVVGIQHVVTARRLADRPVLEALRSGREHRGDGDRDEGEPPGDGAPRMARAPAADRGD